MVDLVPRSSYAWKRMLQVREQAEFHIGWIVRSGNSSFGFDNWLGTGALAGCLDSISDHCIRDFCNNGA